MLAELEVARAAVVGAALPCVAAGFALTAAAGMRKPLGAEYACAPVGLVDRSLTALVVPVATLVLLAAPTALAVTIPLAIASPGGLGASPAVLLALASAVLCAAAGSTALRTAWTREGNVARGGMALIASALATGAVAPLEPAARALAGSGGVGWSLATSGLTAVAGLCAWAMLGDRTTQQDVGRGRSRLISPRPLPAVFETATALLVRRRDVRSAAVGAIVIAGAGLAVARLEEAPAPTGALLAAAGAAVALAPVGLTVGGATLDGRELWRTAPRPAPELAAGWALASFAVTATAIVGVLALAAATRALRPEDTGRVIAIAVGAWACALAAGALVPWRRVGVGEQAVSLGVFGLLAAGASFAAGRAGPSLTGHGVPSSIAAAALVGAVIGAAFVSLSFHVARRR